MKFDQPADESVLPQVSQANPLATGRLYDLIWFPRSSWLEDLADAAQPEPWSSGTLAQDQQEPGANAPRHHDILHNYFIYYTRRIIDEGLFIERITEEVVCIAAFDTGLLSRVSGEPLYAIFERNKQADRQPWVHQGWVTPDDRRLMKYFEEGSLKRARFFNDPGEVVFDPNCDVVPNVAHIVIDRGDRFPRDVPQHLRQDVLRGGIARAVQRSRTNWRLAAPMMFYNGPQDTGRITLLLPLTMGDPDRVDLALVVERITPTSYRAATILTLTMAYKNARVITRPESTWLHVNEP